jgi:hypothetical protein
MIVLLLLGEASLIGDAMVADGYAIYTPEGHLVGLFVLLCS